MNAIRAMLAQGRMAAPAAARGEADVAFAWDGVTFGVGTLDQENLRYPITVTLTKAGATFAGEALCFAFVSEADSIYMNGDPVFAADDEASILHPLITEGRLCIIRYQGAPLSAWL